MSNQQTGSYLREHRLNLFEETELISNHTGVPVSEIDDIESGAWDRVSLAHFDKYVSAIGLKVVISE